MNVHEQSPCSLINYCSEIDDFRPVQSTLLTRFSSQDSSDFWRTTNQDYGAFYYRQTPRYCIPDNLKSKLHQRHNRFQDWLNYQTKCQKFPSSINRNSNQQTIFPSNRNETVRITHRKRFLPNCPDSSSLRNRFSPCGESGLVRSSNALLSLSSLTDLDHRIYCEKNHRSITASNQAGRVS